MMTIGVPVIGALMGWIAAALMRSSGLSRWSSIGIGVLGAMIGFVVLSLLEVPLPPLLVRLLGPWAGAAIFLAITYAAHAHSFPRRQPSQFRAGADEDQA
jgi:uncharacterized membrane protein YeaQ/YmgE (transglycosylase-associated protein family)